MAPTITTPPQSITANPGDSVTFTVVASGTAPLSYQWEFNGAPIAGATASSLTLNNVDTAVAGTYSVIVSNAGGSVTSAAVLVVNTPPSITSQPANQAVNPGANVTFVVQATGSTPLNYQWQFNGIDLSGADGPVLTLTNVQAADAGGYKVVVSNLAGSIASAVAYLTVLLPTGQTPPSITVQPSSLEVSSNANVALCATIFGSPPLSCQWYLNGMPLADGGNLSGTATSCLGVLGAQLTNAGTYTLVVSNALGSVTSDPAVLLVAQSGGEVDFSNLGIAPVFDVDGVTRLSGPGYLAQLYAGPATNSLAPIGPAVPFYSGDLAGYWSSEPDEVRDIITVAPGTPALVQVRVWQGGLGLTFEQAAAAGSKVGASAVLELTTGGNSVPPFPPTPLTGLRSFALQSPLAIATQPASQAVGAGTTVAFSVSAVGVAPLAFQWFYNGNAIAGATNSTLTLPSVQPAQAGGYSVSVSNPTGTISSVTATLTILSAPAILTGPQSEAVLAGANVSFTV
ncbi:MAG: immunoglobulin domain-containing protein, partial [Verrucomicrobia bacterium]|nr:immunoglobulin domain-containing protein [Verrucomicrobiota bacterium]